MASLWTFNFFTQVSDLGSFGPSCYKSDPFELDLWPSYLNVNRGHVSKTNQYVETIYSEKNPCDLDLLSCEPKINTGHIRAKANQHEIWKLCDE